jgi:ABC-type dipeptide/oligopeptide/nickel transport system ATPase subunit
MWSVCSICSLVYLDTALLIYDMRISVLDLIITNSVVISLIIK